MKEKIIVWIKVLHQTNKGRNVGRKKGLWWFLEKKQETVGAVIDTLRAKEKGDVLSVEFDGFEKGRSVFKCRKRGGGKTLGIKAVRGGKIWNEVGKTWTTVKVWEKRKQGASGKRTVCVSGTGSGWPVWPRTAISERRGGKDFRFHEDGEHQMGFKERAC